MKNKRSKSRGQRNYLDAIVTGVKSPGLIDFATKIEEELPPPAKSLMEIEIDVKNAKNAKNLKKARVAKVRQNRKIFNEVIMVKEPMFVNYINLMIPLAETIKDALKPMGWTLGMVNNKFVARKGDHYITSLLTLRKMVSKLNPDYFLSGWSILNGWNKWISGFNSSKFQKSSLNPNRKNKVTFKAILPKNL